MFRTVLITGCGGFLGGHLAQYFLAQGWRVIGLFHQSQSMLNDKEHTLRLLLQKESLLSRLEPEHRTRFTDVDGDIMDREAMHALFQTYRPDAMIHAAALLLPPTEKEYSNPVQLQQAIETYIAINQAAILADCAADYHQKTPGFYCVLVSTIHVFKPSAAVIDEAAPRVSISEDIYGHSKNEAESYWMSKGLNLSVLYPPQIYGAYQFTPAMMPRLMRKMLFNQGDILTLSGEMHPISVSNMIRLMHRLCETATVGHFCVAGDGMPMSLEEIAASLRQASEQFLQGYAMMPYHAYIVSTSHSAPSPTINASKLRGIFSSEIRQPVDFKSMAMTMVSSMWRRMTVLVTDYQTLHFPGMTLSLEMHKQLYWLYNNSVNTSQSHPQVRHASDDLNQEIKRVLSRLHNLRLLQNGSVSAYHAFIAAQPESEQLQWVHFQTWSQLIKTQSPAATQCLIASCFMTKSDEAVRAAKRLSLTVSMDSERFLTDIVTQSPTLFPVCKHLDEEAQQLLAFVFLKNSHARQMLDMEGTRALFDVLREKIKQGSITKEQYNLWFARWVLNICGLKGHVETRGACYFTNPLAESLEALKHTLDGLWDDADHDVYITYLTFRQNQLGVGNLYLAQLGAMLRKHTPDVGAEIQAWFDALPEVEGAKYLASFEKQLATLKVAPTYKPVVLDNLLGLGCSIAKALMLFSQIEFKAMQCFEQGVLEQRIAEDVPLCYREVAHSESLEHLIEYYDATNDMPDIDLDVSQGMAMIARIPAYEKQLTLAI